MKYDLALNPPLMNTPGTLGFAPSPRGRIALSSLGAFITNPISLEARTPAALPRCLPTPGGFLLHTGHPNPGLRAAVKSYASAWGRASLPVLVHLLVQSPDEVTAMLRRLEGLPGVVGFEIGFPPDVTPTLAHAIAQAAMGGLPVVLRLPMERAAELAPAIAPLVEDDFHSLAAFSLAAPRGSLPLPEGGVVTGRLYGPAVFPLALAALRQCVKFNVPIFAGGGVYQASQAQALLQAGAAAVQLDAALWRSLGGWPADQKPSGGAATTR